jgi:hypothetical protein
LPRENYRRNLNDPRNGGFASASIETAALFFSVTAVKYCLDHFHGMRSVRTASLFVLFSTLGILQKATTALPVLGILWIAFLVPTIKAAGPDRSMRLVRNVLGAALLFAIPVVVGFAWVVYTDHVKLANPLGVKLTSAALRGWNWGTFAQKASLDVWWTMLWARVLQSNMGGVLGVFTLLMPFFVRAAPRTRAIATGALALGIVPFALFTNLHFVHDYYQTANALFLAYALAVAIGTVVLPALGTAATLLLILLIVASNHLSLKQGYMPLMRATFTKENNRDLAIGALLRREIPVGTQFVAFGNDWNSSFAYFSQRKSLTMPEWSDLPGWSDRLAEAISHPERFVDKGGLGGVVACSTSHPNVAELLGLNSEGRSWRIGETHGCLIAVPERTPEAMASVSARCTGAIDRAAIEDRSGFKVLSIAGWTVTGDAKPTAPDEVFLIVSGREGPPLSLQALKVPRIDVNTHLSIPADDDVGFSRIVSGDLKPGDYTVQVVQYAGGRYSACGIGKTFQVQ